MTSKSSKTPNAKLPPEHPRSILKKSDTLSSCFEETCSHTQKSVKFVKSKDVEQVRLRTKLNAWLETKGKTPSRCRHLMCFDKDLSAKKKRGSMLQGRLSEDLLTTQQKVLGKQENQSVKKELFKAEKVKKEVSAKTPPVKRISDTKYGWKKRDDSKRSSITQHHGRENVRARTFSDRTNAPSKSPHNKSKIPSQSPRGSLINNQTENKGHSMKEESSQPTTPSTPAVDQVSQITEQDIQENLHSMLDECLTLLRAGCPPENILPWLYNMELHIPQTHKSALFYACKAEVFSDRPLDMLHVFCQGIEQKAEPSEVLSNAMKQFLTPHLTTTTQSENEIIPASSQFTSPLPCEDNIMLSEKHLNPSPDFEDDVDAEPPSTKVESKYCHRHVDKVTNNMAPFDGRVKTTSTLGTPLKMEQCTDRELFGLSGDNIYSSVIKTPPVKRERIYIDRDDSASQLGSTIKYSVSTLTPIPGQSSELMPKSMLTPVRRSTRLSNRHPTPQLTHEIGSVSDLTLREAESTVYQPNPAIKGRPCNQLPMKSPTLT